jgi:hypothetical protein
VIPERVLEPFTEASFRTGLSVGVLLLLVGVAASGLWRLRRRRPFPVAGVLIATAGAVAVVRVERPVPGLVLGLLLLGVTGAVIDATPRLRPLLPALALPGALVVATGVEVSQSWAPFALGIAVAGGGALVADFDRRWSARPLSPAMLVVSLAGVFLTVPETKEALPVLGAALPLALLGWPTNLASLGAGGSLASTGLLVWTVGQGGTFRDSAIVGGVACLGLLATEPLARLAHSPPDGRRLPRPPGVLVAMVAAHVVVVVLAARVAGLGDDLGVAVVLAALTLFAGGLASLAIRAGAHRTPFREVGSG